MAGLQLLACKFEDLLLNNLVQFGTINKTVWNISKLKSNKFLGFSHKIVCSLGYSNENAETIPQTVTIPQETIWNNIDCENIKLFWISYHYIEKTVRIYFYFNVHNLLARILIDILQYLTETI